MCHNSWHGRRMKHERKRENLKQIGEEGKERDSGMNKPRQSGIAQTIT